MPQTKSQMEDVALADSLNWQPWTGVDAIPNRKRFYFVIAAETQVGLREGRIEGVTNGSYSRTSYKSWRDCLGGEDIDMTTVEYALVGNYKKGTILALGPIKPDKTLSLIEDYGIF